MISRNKLYSLQKIRRRAGAVASAFLRTQILER
nr:MAG TPA: hypothetical protein [Caudoviricetes sp.]DAX15286.1 MAG TPA: hypothetical protein [Caudoviricetes sp.]